MLCNCVMMLLIFVFKQKTAYEMRISDWSSDVCSADLAALDLDVHGRGPVVIGIPEAAAIRRGRAADRPARAVNWRRRRRSHPAGRGFPEIGRASCTERVCPYVSSSVVAVSLTTQHVLT